MKENRMRSTLSWFVSMAMLVLAGCGGGSPSTNTTHTLSGKETVLYSFGAGSTDGQHPIAGLVMDSAGNLYGTTYYGGVNGDGTVFKISAAGTETVLYSFKAGSTDGANPQSGLIMDNAGNLYGTTYYGGVNGDGTVFKISAAGTETVLYSFKAGSTDGENPQSGLVMDSSGDLYGTTTLGGANGNGTVFKISSAGTETILHSFGVSDGHDPLAGLVIDNAGNLYGTTMMGGANGIGTVYEISASGTETVLYSFGANSTDGGEPQAGLAMDSAGNLYGTTWIGGANSISTVYKISAAGTETILHSFGASSTDGKQPWARLVIDSAGNLYGTTMSGGDGIGTVYEISASGVETVLYSFGASSTDGQNPQAGLIMDSAGNLYGTTYSGGANGYGTVFEIQ
jgi:uncharacterized repeat protein (TIGR03803 family)